jgi:hypothetical protein
MFRKLSMDCKRHAYLSTLSLLAEASLQESRISMLQGAYVSMTLVHLSYVVAVLYSIEFLESVYLPNM